MSQALIRVFLATVFVFAIAACGEGSGGENSASSSGSSGNNNPVQPVPVPPNPAPGVPVLTMEDDQSSPPATKRLSTDVDSFVANVSAVSNPTGISQQLAIPSASVEGDLAEWVEVSIVDENGVVLATATPSGGRAYFANLSVAVLGGGEKKLTQKLKFDQSMPPLDENKWTGKVRVGFAAGDIVPPSGVAIQGLPEWSEYVYAERGTTFLPCMARSTLDNELYPVLCSENMWTGEQTVIWGEYQKYPLKITPARSGSMIAFQAYNKDAIMALSLPDLSVREAISFNRKWGPDGSCSNSPEGTFDLNYNGSRAVISSRCLPEGQPERRGIAVMTMDGSMNWSLIAGGIGDNFKNFSPAIVGVPGAASNVFSVFFASNRGEGGEIGIWQKASDGAALALVVNTGFTLENYDLSGMEFFRAERFFSVSRDYGSIVYMKKVNGEIFLFVRSLSDGTEVNIGKGRNPDWAKDGSERIRFTLDGDLWIVNPDGTEKRKANIDHLSTFGNGGRVDGRSGVVFGASPE